MIEFTLGVVSTVVLAAFVWSLVKIYKLTKHTEYLEEFIKTISSDTSRTVDQFYRNIDDHRRSIQDQLNYFERHMEDHFVKKENKKQLLKG